MAKATDPRALTDCFDFEPERLADLGVLNPTLAIDTKLFIDPLLLSQSTHSEINSKAVSEYREHFEQVSDLEFVDGELKPSASKRRRSEDQ